MSAMKLITSIFCAYTVLLLTEVQVSNGHPRSNAKQSAQVLRLDIKNDTDVLWLVGMVGKLEEKMGADFWTSPSINHPVDILLPSGNIKQLEILLRERGISYSVMIENVQELIAGQMREIRSRRNEITTNLEFDYGKYHSYEEIRKWVKDFSSENSDIAEEFVVTKSYDGREIAGVKLSVPNSQSNKKSVWFEGGIHAREWIAPATVLFITQQLVREYRNGDQDVQRFLNNLDFYIVPSLNVDGYAYTWSNDRLWRKTRSPNWNPLCRGTDGNRNWPYEWGGPYIPVNDCPTDRDWGEWGSGGPCPDGPADSRFDTCCPPDKIIGVRASKNPCNETYRGSGPASEVEIQGVVDFTAKLAQTQEFAVFIDWHSYSQAWMAPWSYSKQAPPPADEADQLALAKAAVEAIRSVHGTLYRSGAAATTLYEASGFSIDWSYAVLNAKYSYCVELRDLGKYGFLLPEDQIIPTGEECYAAVKVVANWVLDENNI